MARSQLDIILNLVDKGSAKGIDGLVKGISAMAIALGAAKVAGDVWRAGMEGAALKKAEKAFEGMAKSVGQDIHAIGRAMVKATDGAIDMQTAMESASAAIRLGVAETPEEFAKLARAATNLGAAMGRGPVEAISDIVRGVGRMSPLILDNIGIMTNGGQVFEDYAASVGKTASELSDAEKKQVLLNKAIEDGSKLPDAQTTGFEKMDAAFKDISNIVKKQLAPALEKVASALAKGIRGMETAQEKSDTLTRAYEIGAISAEQYAGIQSAVGRGAMSLDQAATIAVLAIQAWEKSYSGITSEGHEAAGVTEGLISNLENIPEVTPIHIDWDDGGAAAGMKTIIDRLVRAQNLAEGGIQSTALGIALESRRGEFSGGLGSKLEPGGATGANFVVPPGFPSDSFPFRASSGERVIIQPASGGRSFFDNSTVNINNGTSMDAFEGMLRGLA